MNELQSKLAYALSALAMRQRVLEQKDAEAAAALASNRYEAWRAADEIASRIAVSITRVEAQIKAITSEMARLARHPKDVAHDITVWEDEVKDQSDEVGAALLTAIALRKAMS